MDSVLPPGTAGYGKVASALLSKRLRFEEAHGHVPTSFQSAQLGFSTLAPGPVTTPRRWRIVGAS
jgi:hypothetical protein